MKIIHPLTYLKFQLFTDGWFLEGLDLYLRKRLTHQKSGPTFVYLFSHKGAASFTEIFGGGRENYYGKNLFDKFSMENNYKINYEFGFSGVCHAEELQYLFPIGRSLFYNSLPTKEDEKIRKALTELWVNFARSGYAFR